MSIEIANHDNGTLEKTARQTAWRRRFAILVLIVFAISSAFPVVAGLSHDTASFPEWWGTLDVGIALFLGALMFAILGLAHKKVESVDVEIASYRAYRRFPLFCE